VTLELDGVVRNAIFKKVDKDHDSWRREVADYELVLVGNCNRGGSGGGSEKPLEAEDWKRSGSV
jgi:hypothetical protein